MAVGFCKSTPGPEEAMKLLWFHLMPYTELPDDFRVPFGKAAVR